MSLRKRIFIAVAAILFIHFGFYFVPRWHAARERVYEEAYDDAVALAEKVFGAGALEDGIVSIEKAAVCIPRRGMITAPAPDGGVRLLYLDVDKAWLIEDPPESGLRFRRISVPDARHVFAVCLYFSLVESTMDNVRFESFPGGLSDAAISDSTWLWRKAWSGSELDRPIPGRENSFSEETHLTAERVLFAKLVADLMSHVADELQTPELPPEEAHRALRDVLEASYPTKNFTERGTVAWLLKEFARNAGEEDLPVLRRLDRGVFEVPGWVGGIPLVGRRIRDWSRSRSRNARMPDQGRIIRFLEALSGNGDEMTWQKVFDLARLDHGDAPSNVSVSMARALASERWPGKWRAHLLEVYESQPELVTKVYYPKSADNPLVRRMAESADLRVRAKALAALYRATGDAAFKERIRHEALAAIQGLAGTVSPDPQPVMERARARPALSEWDKAASPMWTYFRLSRESGRSEDIIDLARSVLRSSPAASVELGERISRNLASEKGRAVELFLYEAAVEPEKVFAEGFHGTKAEYAARAEAFFQLCRRTGVGLIRLYFERRLYDEWDEIEEAFVEEFSRAAVEGDLARIITVLRNEQGRIGKEIDPGWYLLAEAVEILSIRNAADPFAHYRGLEQERRRRIPFYVLREVLTGDDIRKILAETDEVEERARMIAALVDTSEEGHINWWVYSDDGSGHGGY